MRNIDDALIPIDGNDARLSRARRQTSRLKLLPSTRP